MIQAGFCDVFVLLYFFRLGSIMRMSFLATKITACNICTLLHLNRLDILSKEKKSSGKVLETFIIARMDNWM